MGFDDDEPISEETIRRVMKRFRDESDSDLEPRRRPERKGLRFDATLNLGQVITSLLFISGIVAIWTNAKVTAASHEMRITSIEGTQSELRASIRQLNENEATGLRTQERIATTLDWLVKERQNK